MKSDTAFSISNPKIDPSLKAVTPVKTGLKPDGTPDDNDRIEFGPTALAFKEWEDLGITMPNLDRMRQTRLDRLAAELRKRDYAGALMFDPLNIRYASDSSNMQLWTAHNPARACFVSAEGYMVLWDFHGCDHLSSYLPLIQEHRHGAGFFYFVAGDKEEDLAAKFAAQVDDLLRTHGGDNRRLAVDKIEVAGVHALEKHGIQIGSGQEVCEHARLIKGIDEINAMRCAMATCEISVNAMQQVLEPGITETQLWAELHAENIKRGGEWIETRILSSGPRTNPWMQEAGPRVIQNNEIVSFDTDLIGPYGYCSDISRSWFCGDGQPSAQQRHLQHVAYDHIMSNMAMLKPGVSFRELTEKGKRLPPEFVQQRYGVMMHGVGLCDEFPAILYPEDFIEGAFDYILEPGMTLCVEAYIGAVDGREGVKLEDQVLITENGYENMTTLAFDEKLMTGFENFSG